jgi:NAD(P)-dependent dehydrogenase (short-subunit alcohol dehydrogenase family)
MKFIKKNNQNILVLGGSGRIGSQIVKNLTSIGYNVFVIDKIKNKNLKKNKMIICDMSKINLFNRKFDSLVKKIKTIDAVINLSYLKNKNWGKKFLKLKPDDVKENLFLQMGTIILTSQKIIEFYLKQKYGNLILFSSIQGISAPKFIHYKNTSMSSPIEYSAVKAGIINITKYMAKFCERKKIRINCVSPGGILDNQPKNFIKKYKDSCLSKGLLDSRDLNGIVEFLISNKSNFINGQNFIIDDGWSL